MTLTQMPSIDGKIPGRDGIATILELRLAVILSKPLAHIMVLSIQQ